MENLEIQDESGDKDHFTIIPNYIANHSSAIDQALYFQMKKYAGSKGKCYVSKKTLMEKLQIGNFKLSKSINYLLEHKWIEYVGKTIVQTSGGPQEVDSYKIIDIWKLNSDYYEKLKGASRLEHLKTKGLLDFHKGVLIGKTKKIILQRR